MGFDRAFIKAVRIVGLIGAAWTIFIDKLERPTLLVLLAAMMGLADKFAGRPGGGP